VQEDRHSAGAVHARLGAGQPRRGRLSLGDDRRGWGSARLLVQRARGLHLDACTDTAGVAAVRATVPAGQAAMAPGGRLARCVIILPTVPDRSSDVIEWGVLRSRRGARL